MLNYIRADCMCALAPLTPIGNGLKCEGAAFQTAFGVVI